MAVTLCLISEMACFHKTGHASDLTNPSPVPTVWRRWSHEGERYWKIWPGMTSTQSFALNSIESSQVDTSCTLGMFFWAKTQRMWQLVRFDGIIVYPCASFKDGTITGHRLVWVIVEARCKDGCRLSDGAGVSFGECRDPFYFPYNLQHELYSLDSQSQTEV